VRDIYDIGDKMVFVTTDRLSAFDRVITRIPFKGQVLNQTSLWWFEKTKHIIDNALVESLHPNVTVMKKLEVVPIEFIVRGYMTGSTETSLWTNYKNGCRLYCGNVLEDHMVKNQRLSADIVTPTTKGDIDELISGKEIVESNILTQEEWEYLSEVSLRLFDFGKKEAIKRGLMLVDTKYEFGRDEEGNFYLIDEIHTPDSSRYWIANTYENNIAKGLEQDNIDKEFIGLWFKDHCNPYADVRLPEAPEELVIELSKRYIYLYETITGETFEPDAYPSHSVLF
jgi:phosphoribosylaminoimidazole-succinocarboxamide synthase